MNTTVAKEHIIHDLDTLTAVDLKEVLDFISFLKNRDEIDPTMEIIEDEEYYNSVQQGLKDIKEGRTHDWNDVR